MTGKREGGDTTFTMSVLTCEQCGKSFLQAESLAAHKGNHD